MANSLPAINDITAPELRGLLAEATQHCPVLRAARSLALQVRHTPCHTQLSAAGLRAWVHRSHFPPPPHPHTWTLHLETLCLLGSRGGVVYMSDDGACVKRCALLKPGSPVLSEDQARMLHLQCSQARISVSKLVFGDISAHI